MTVIDHVQVLEVPGLYLAHSVASTSQYLVDTRPGLGPRWFRHRGLASFRGRFDGAWQPMTGLIASRVVWNGDRWLEPDEINTGEEPWTLRVGSAHEFSTPDLAGRHGPEYWVDSSACRLLEVLDEVPDWAGA